VVLDYGNESEWRGSFCDIGVLEGGFLLCGLWMWKEDGGERGDINPFYLSGFGSGR